MAHIVLEHTHDTLLSAEKQAWSRSKPFGVIGSGSKIQMTDFLHRGDLGIILGSSCTFLVCKEANLRAGSVLVGLSEAVGLETLRSPQPFYYIPSRKGNKTILTGQCWKQAV